MRGGRNCGQSGGENRASPKSKSPNPGTGLVIILLGCFLSLFSGPFLTPLFCGYPLSPTLGSQTETEALERILTLAADYCKRLYGASLYYVCQEDVRESHISSVERSSPYGPLTLETSSWSRHWVYDYQLVRTPLGLSEVRTLIEAEGEKKKEPGARLETEDFDFKTVILGPNGMFGAENRGAFNFALTEEHTLEGEEVLVVKATPKEGVQVRVLYGTAWLRLRDGAALRVDWDKKSMRNVSSLDEETKTQRKIPELIFRSDYGFEKNGLRFPSRYSISLEQREPTPQKLLFSPEEKKKTAIQVEVVYSDYKFFTVEVEVKDSGPGLEADRSVPAVAEGFVLGLAAAAERHPVPRFVFKTVGGFDRDAALDPNRATRPSLGIFNQADR